MVISDKDCIGVGGSKFDLNVFIYNFFLFIVLIDNKIRVYKTSRRYRK